MLVSTEHQWETFHSVVCVEVGCSLVTLVLNCIYNVSSFRCLEDLGLGCQALPPHRSNPGKLPVRCLFKVLYCHKWVIITMATYSPPQLHHHKGLLPVEPTRPCPIGWSSKKAPIRREECECYHSASGAWATGHWELHEGGGIRRVLQLCCTLTGWLACQYHPWTVKIYSSNLASCRKSSNTPSPLFEWQCIVCTRYVK